MSQITHGIRAVLSHPAVYDAFQNLMGAKRNRARFARERIRALPGMRVLDIGCGTGEILPFLPQGIDYHGYDISEAYIEAARKRHGDRGHFNCRLFDAAEAERLGKVDVVLAIGLLHHLDDAEAAELAKLAKSVLKPGGRLVTLDGCYAPGQNPLARFLISRDRGRNVRAAEGYRALVEPHFAEVTGEIAHRSWIPYTHWIMECRA